MVSLYKRLLFLSLIIICAGRVEACEDSLSQFGLEPSLCHAVYSHGQSEELLASAQRGECVLNTQRLISFVENLGIDASKLDILALVRTPNSYGYPNLLVPNKLAVREGVQGIWAWHMAIIVDGIVVDPSYSKIMATVEDYWKEMWSEFYGQCSKGDCLIYKLSISELPAFTKPKANPRAKPAFLEFQNISVEKLLGEFL